MQRIPLNKQHILSTGSSISSGAPRLPLNRHTSYKPCKAFIKYPTHSPASSAVCQPRKVFYQVRDAFCQPATYSTDQAKHLPSTQRVLHQIGNAFYKPGKLVHQINRLFCYTFKTIFKQQKSFPQLAFYVFFFSPINLFFSSFINFAISALFFLPFF